MAARAGADRVTALEARSTPSFARLIFDLCRCSLQWQNAHRGSSNRVDTPTLLPYLPSYPNQNNPDIQVIAHRSTDLSHLGEKPNVIVAEVRWLRVID